MSEHWWLWVLAITCGATSLVQLSQVLICKRIGKSRVSRQRLQQESSLRRSALVARLASQVNHSNPSARSITWRILEVASVIDESADCRSFVLVDPYHQSLPLFHPGQYVMVRPAMAGAYQTTRCYSLSGAPDERFWRITVKLHGALEQRPTGNRGLSAWLHLNISAGDCLFVGGPAGQFYLSPESNSELVLLAAGVGITPIASMAAWSAKHTPHRKVTIAYQAKDQAHWPLGEELLKLAQTNSNLRIVTYFSRQDLTQLQLAGSSGSGSSGFFSGKYRGKDVCALASTTNSEFYLCGPDDWMMQLRDELIEGGVTTSHIHWESFGEATTTASTTTGSTQGHAITFNRSEVSAQWSDPQQSLWECARENHVEIPSGCLSGVCGACCVRVLSGKVEHVRKVGIELSENECLACIARPTSDLRIDC